MKLFLYATAVLLLIILLPFGHCQTKQSCHSPVYCQGELLHQVQTAGIFNDSKSFVDMAMVDSQNETLKAFRTLMMEADNEPNRKQLIDFVAKHFIPIGELEEIQPVDFKPEPKIIKEINDPVVRKFAKDVISIWPSLTRTVSYHVKTFPDSHSLIPVDYPFIIPGGRFKEFYYWDSYWVVKGLLLSDMTETAKGMILNFMSMVERYGFIPNGGRIYYLNRSQPPLLTLMVADYVYYTNDYEFLKDNIKTLDKELNFWLQKRLIETVKNGRVYILAHYDSESDTPRPESYKEDIETCEIHNEEEKYECYTDLKSGAESGWDFTSRWLFDEFGEPHTGLQNINTRRNVPVDLNSFLYKSFETLYKFYMVLDNEDDAKFWLTKANEWKEAIEAILYHEGDGIWYDYDLKLEKPRRYYFASNFVPLWAGAMDEHLLEHRASRAVEYLQKKNVNLLRGGLPASLFPTGEQWDYPNAWSPYQNLVILGLWKTGDADVKEFARQLGHNWINSNMRGFHDNKVMFEKYDAVNVGQFGSGGEYLIQAGFGWSNGCILELIDVFFRAKTRKYKGLT